MPADFDSTDAGPPDSLTLGQLKKIVAHFPKPKMPQYDFRYDDSDNLFNEIDECYSYGEIRQLTENKAVFDEVFPNDWTDSTVSEKLVFIETRLADFELLDAVRRMVAAKQLLYIAQGTFGSLSTPEQHLHYIIENNRLLRQSGALVSYFNFLKEAAASHEHLCHADDIPPAQRDALLEETISEIAIGLTLLYMQIEIFRGDAIFGAEMMNLDPPLPIFLIRFLTRLRDHSRKGFPIKKLLLTIWKSLLGTLGGMRDLERAKQCARKEAGLKGAPDNSITKCTPLDYEVFRTEITSKYPAYAPPAIAKVTTDQIRIPHTMPHRTPLLAPSPSLGNAQLPGLSTPAPSPPSTPGPNQTTNVNGQPKSKKQLYQTDPRQPFIFPFSSNSPEVPLSIREAGELYLKHMYVGLDVWQLWKEREASMARDAVAFEPSDSAEIEALALSSVDTMRPRQRGGDETDKQNLARVEVLYRALVPQLQSTVLVLLKLLLTAVTNGSNTSGTETIGGTEAINNHSQVKTTEDIENIRHREISIKAISAILLLILKWFKVSHVLKAEYVSQLLLDANCVLLILKIFGLQDMIGHVKIQHEIDEMNFFKFCTKHGKINGKEDVNGSAMLPREESDELITDFSWRNFFSTINLLRILQKLTKRKTHRILLLVQYKASAILKRMLKVSHAGLQLYVLKILKSQVPFCGRKWRSSNMKVITAIFLNCRPELRDEWIAGIDVEGDVEESLPAEQALRSLVKFYNERRGYLSLSSEDMFKSESRESAGHMRAQRNGNAGNMSLSIFDMEIESGLPELDQCNLDSIFPVFDGKGVYERFTSLQYGDSGASVDNMVLDEQFTNDYERWLMDEVSVW